MRNTLLFSYLSVVMFFIGLTSCSSKSSNSPDVRTNYSIEFVNTTSKYCVAIYFDGKTIVSDSEGGDWKLWAGQSTNQSRTDINYPIDVRVDWYEIKDATHYYTKVVASATKKDYKFSPEYQYKVTIRDREFSITPVALK